VSALLLLVRRLVFFLVHYHRGLPTVFLLLLQAEPPVPSHNTPVTSLGGGLRGFGCLFESFSMEWRKTNQLPSPTRLGKANRQNRSNLHIRSPPRTNEAFCGHRTERLRSDTCLQFSPCSWRATYQSLWYSPFGSQAPR